MDAVSQARELTRRYLDGRATAEELQELQALLQGSPTAANAFAQQTRLEGDLKELFAREQDIRQESALLDTIRRREQRRRWAGRAVRFAIAAGLLLAVGASLWWWLTRPDEKSGPARHGAEVVQGEVEPHADALRVVSAEAVLLLADGSRATLRRDSLVVLHGQSEGLAQRVELQRGEGRFAVRESGQGFQVDTPVGSVIALGTEFEVSLSNQRGVNSMKWQHLILAVTVMSGIVQVKHNGTTSFIDTGESRVFGDDRDKPREGERRDGERRPAVRGQRGLVIAVEKDKLTVVTGNERDLSEKTFNVADSVKVTIDGKAAKLADLKRGMMVVLAQADRDGGLASISAVGPELSGFVKEVGKDSITLARGREGRNAEGLTFSLSDGAKVTIDGKDGKLADLKAGDQVGIGLSADRKKVMSIAKGRADGERRGDERGREAVGRVFGKVKSFKKGDGTITVIVGERGDERVLNLAKEVKVTIDNKAANLDDIKADTGAWFFIDRDRKVATIVVGRLRRGDGEKRDGERRDDARVIGKVKGTEKADNTITLLLGENAEEKVFDLSKEVKVTINGKAAKVSDIKADMKAALTFDKDRKVTAITIGEARRGEGERKKENEGERKEKKEREG